MTFTDFISQTLTDAAVIANQHFGKVSGSVKTGDNNQVLTDADIAIGKQIVGAIQKEYPQHNIIDEEAGVIDNHSDTTWVVDPIDGTSNFANGLPTYGIMIGLLQNNKPIAGGIMLPAFNELYVGGVEHPATMNNQPIHVSSEPTLLNSLIAYGIDGHQEDPSRTKDEVRLLGKIVLSIRNLRSTNSAYDLAKTAQGKYGLILNQTTKIWDNIAVHALMEAAGGVCTDFFGQPINYTNHLQKSAQNMTICAGAPHLHQEIQQIIASHSG